jgi:hypothetical protein
VQLYALTEGSVMHNAIYGADNSASIYAAYMRLLTSPT